MLTLNFCIPRLILFISWKSGGGGGAGNINEDVEEYVDGIVLDRMGGGGGSGGITGEFGLNISSTTSSITWANSLSCLISGCRLIFSIRPWSSEARSLYSSTFLTS